MTWEACDQPLLEDLCVSSQFLFTEKDFKEYFIPAQIWMTEWYVKIWSPFAAVIGIPIAIGIIITLVNEWSSLDALTRVVLCAAAFAPFGLVVGGIYGLYRHHHPRLNRMQGDIEVFFIRLALGRPAMLYGDTGSFFEEIKNLKEIAHRLGVTKDNPSGGRQSRPLGIVMQARLCDDCIVAGLSDEVVVSDFRRDVAWIIESKRFLIIRNSNLVDAVFDKRQLQGADPKDVKRFIKMKKRGKNVLLEDVVWHGEEKRKEAQSWVIGKKNPCCQSEA